MCEICWKLTIKHQNNLIDVVLVFLLLTLNRFHTHHSDISLVDYEQVNAGWVMYQIMLTNFKSFFTCSMVFCQKFKSFKKKLVRAGCRWVGYLHLKISYSVYIENKKGLFSSIHYLTHLFSMRFSDVFRGRERMHWEQMGQSPYYNCYIVK